MVRGVTKHASVKATPHAMHVMVSARAHQAGLERHSHNVVPVATTATTAIENAPAITVAFNHVTGICTSAPGWTGEDYRRGSYDNKCQPTCQCQNNATCDRATEVCTSRPGYQGLICEKLCDCSCQKSCPDGLYGTNCSKSCSCPVNSTCCSENKARNEKQAKYTYDPLLPIELSVSVICANSIAVTACVAYRKCRKKTSKTHDQQDYDVKENAACEDTRNIHRDVNNAPSYMDLRRVAQSGDHPVYHETDNSAVDRELYQPLNADRRIYQARNKSHDDKDNAHSPVTYSYLPTKQKWIDGNELYLTILSDQVDKNSNNVTYNKQHREYDSSTNSSLLYGNLHNGEEITDKNEPYLTVLPDDVTLNQPTYEIQYHGLTDVFVDTRFLHI